MQKFILVVALALSSTAFASQYSSDTYQERETLSRLLEQVNNLMPLADLAETQALNGAQRHRFDYVALKRDLVTLQHGLRHYLESPMEPRSLNHDLNGSYRDFNE